MTRKKARVIEQQVSVSYTYTRRLQLEDKTCPVCGKCFEGVKKRRYCSRPCQAKADYQRHADTYRQLRRDTYRRQKEQDVKQ